MQNTKTKLYKNIMTTAETITFVEVPPISYESYAYSLFS